MIGKQYLSLRNPVGNLGCLNAPPALGRRFPLGRAKTIMREILQEKLEGETFSSEHAKPIADEIRSQIRGTARHEGSETVQMRNSV